MWNGPGIAGREALRMREMTRKERIMAATRKDQVDRFPFLHWWRHMQIGWAEREAEVVPPTARADCWKSLESTPTVRGVH